MTLNRSLFHIMLLTATAASSVSQAVETSPHGLPLGLRRLTSNAEHPEVAPLSKNKYAVDELVVSSNAGGVTKRRKNGVSFLEILEHDEWSRPLRGGGDDLLFVSFQAFASQSTFVDVGGAKLGVTASDLAGYAQLMVQRDSGEWRPIGMHLPFERFDGKLLAVLPVLTVRLDPAADVFDLFGDARLLADNLPLGATNGVRRFAVTPGSEGAWITGLVQADENPLYEDANANGVDDQFEQRKKGRILAANASAEERKQLAQEWRMDQMSSVPPALFYNRPRPDGK